MNVIDFGEAGATMADFDSTIGGGVSTVVFVRGAGEDVWTCEYAEGVDGAG